MRAESEQHDLSLEFNASEKSRLLSAVVDLEARQAVCAAGIIFGALSCLPNPVLMWR